jgi:hypothetical protein
MWSWIGENIEWIAALLITVLFSGLNIVLAVCTLRVTRQQTKIQNDNFCYQLYEKRMSLYESIDRIIVKVAQNGSAVNHDIQEYIVAKKDVEFLFGKDVVQISEEIYKTLCELCSISTLIRDHIDGKSHIPNHKENCDRQHCLMDQLFSQKQKLKECIKQYISFESYRIRS